MKKTSVLLVFTFLYFFAEAKVRTVNNNTNRPGQYTTLQKAIDSSAVGDTIYVHGSATSYGSASIKKRLVLIGTGHNPNKSNKLVSTLNNVQLDTLANISGASGTKIMGFSLNGVFGYSGSGGSKNISISRNHFTSGGTKISITGKSWTIENNIIQSDLINVNNHTNTIIRNNIFNGASILSSNQPTVIISNNIFLGNGSSVIMSFVSNSLISNNIFSGATPKDASINNNIFSNNITYQTAYDTIPYGTNSGSGNYIAKDPLYTNVPTITFNYTYDYTLTALSPGKNGGTDGTDVGVYGGAMPFVDMTGSPAIPQIKIHAILNPVIPVGDSLHIVIKAIKQN